jgi:hypothetical protein
MMMKVIQAFLLLLSAVAASQLRATPSSKDFSVLDSLDSLDSLDTLDSIDSIRSLSIPHTDHIRELSPVTSYSITHLHSSGEHRHLSAYEEGTDHFRLRGNVEQPYPDSIHLSLTALGETFDYDLAVMDHLFPEDGVVTLSGVNEDGAETAVTTNHRLTSYAAYFSNGFATATVLSDGTVHAVIYRDQELYQFDSLEDHEHSLTEEHHRGLRDAAAKTHPPMVAFRRSERFVPKEKASCSTASATTVLDANTPPTSSTTASSTTASSSSSPDNFINTFLTSSNPRNLAANDAGDPDRWTSCFANDNVPRALGMGIATDSLFYTKSGGTENKVKEKVATIIADSNTIYAYQLNIYLTVDNLYIKTSSGGEAWNNAASDTAGTCAQSINDKLDNMRLWAKSGGGRPTEQGLWHLLTPCYYSGTVGLAYVGVLCEMNSGYHTGVSGFAFGSCCSDWGTFAHEVGHNFGADHSFEDGQGATGGIMDYGDGLLNNIYQFNTKYRKDQVCNEVNNNINCKYFTSYAPECGNGVVEAGEECECENGGTSCANCVSCSLPAGKQCASGECCNLATGMFYPASQACSSGICNAGACQAAECGKYGLDYCGAHTNNDCKVKCVYNGACNTMDNFTPVGLNYAPDGAICSTSAGAAGTCSSGTCVDSSSGPTYGWVTGSYGACSVACGSGTQTRSVTCMDSNGNAASSASLCTASKPATTQACTQPACVTYSWLTEAQATYSTCSHDCDGGTKTRIGNACVSSTGTSVSNSLCTSYATNAEPAATLVCGSSACPTSWVTGTYGDCSSSCGGGTQTRTVVCKKTRDGSTTTVSDSSCSGTKPSASQVCNTQACSTYEWMTGNYGDCNTGGQVDPNTGQSCGSGSQSRTVTCVQTNDGNKVVADSQCSGTKPGAVRECSLSECPTAEGGDAKGWVYEDWASCSTSCGEGIQYRGVHCYKGQLDPTDPSRVLIKAGDDLSKIVSDDQCTQAKPRASQECSNPACPEYEYTSGTWSSCSKTCGPGTKTRSVSCSNVASNTPVTVADSFCAAMNLVKPDSSQDCNIKSCSATCGTPGGSPCTGYWSTGMWSSCSKSCGYGTMDRTVQCLSASDDQVTSDQNCAGNRPSPVADCNAFDCPRYVTGEWGECSAKCDDGLATRSVHCLDHLGRVAEGDCDSLTLPADQIACNDRPCAHWHKGLWSDCDAYCGGGKQYRSMDCRLPHDDEYMGVKVDPDEVAWLCPAEKPPIEQDCNIDSCSGFYWNVTNWGDCSKECGSGGIQKREAVCTASGGVELLDTVCVPTAGEKPITQQVCNNVACPSYEWVIVGEGTDAEWGECDADCGGGRKSRTVQCHDKTGDVVFGYTIPFEVVEDSKCPGSKPSETAKCNTSKKMCGSHGKCKSKQCRCKPGFSGQHCDEVPVLDSVGLFTDSDLLTSGMPKGNVLEVRWASSGEVDKVDIFLEPGAEGEDYGDRPASKLPIPVTPNTRYPNDGVFLLNVPGRPHGTGVFDNYKIRVWHADGLSSLSDGFEIGNACAYRSCGAHGTCGSESSECICSDGYTGEDCSIAPCAASSCLESDAGVASCFVNATADFAVTCECEEGFTGESCQHRAECEKSCKNGGIATSAFVAPGQPTQCFPDDDSQPWCTCPLHTVWEGKKCEMCGLRCGKSGKPNKECTDCICNAGWFGNECQCRQDSWKMELDWRSGGVSKEGGSVVGDVIMSLPNGNHDKLMKGGQSSVDLAGLEALFKYDVMKAVLGKLPTFAGSIGDVEITKTGKTTMEVEFEIRQECYDMPIGDHAHFHGTYEISNKNTGDMNELSDSPRAQPRRTLERRVAEEEVEAAVLELDAVEAELQAQGTDEFSTLRAGGILTNSFTKWGKVGGGLSILAIVGIAVGAVCFVGLIAGLVVFKKNGGEFGFGAFRGGGGGGGSKYAGKRPPRQQKRNNRGGVQLENLGGAGRSGGSVSKFHGAVPAAKSFKGKKAFSPNNAKQWNDLI